MADKTPAAQDIPAKVFSNFLEELGMTDVPKEVVANLQRVLLDEPNFSDEALRAAILGEEV